VGCGNAIGLAFKYDFKKIIPLLMIVCERLNPSIQAKLVPSIDGLLIEKKKKPTCLVLGHLWKSFHGH
jgi:hypothetical protein